MKLGFGAGPRVRTVLLAAGCLTAGLIAGPGVANAAQSAIQNVFVTNTAANPVPVTPVGTVPVAPQGTTHVDGTVTVANQPTPEAKPQLIQKRFGDFISDENHGAISFVAFDVPAGKVLTLQYGEIFTIKPYEANTVSFSVGCGGAPEGEIDNAVYNLPELPSGKTWRLYGGPMTLVVPGGHCLRASMHVLETDIPDGTGLGVNGSITGYLEDAH